MKEQNDNGFVPILAQAIAEMNVEQGEYFSFQLPAVLAAEMAQTRRKSFRGTTDSAASLSRKPSQVLQTQIILTDLSSLWKFFSLSLTRDYGTTL